MCQGIAQFNLSNLERIFLSLHHDGHRETSLPAFLARGGAIAILADPQHILGIDPLLMGFGLESVTIYSPNESYLLKQIFAGMESIALFYQYY